MQVIEAHNQEAALGMHSYELGMNHLGDMVRSAPPWKAGWLRPHPPSLGFCSHPSSEVSTNASTVPADV